MTTKRLARALPYEQLCDLLRELCAREGISWSPEAPLHESAEQLRGPYRLRVETWLWTCGELSLLLVRETGDNGATHHMAWEPYFQLEATLSGLPGGATLTLRGGDWGACNLSEGRAQGALATRLLDALIA